VTTRRHGLMKLATNNSQRIGKHADNRGRTLTPANLDTSPSERERASMVRKMESLQAKMDEPLSNSYDVQWEHNVPALTSNEPTEDHTSIDTRKYV